MDATQMLIISNTNASIFSNLISGELYSPHFEQIYLNILTMVSIFSIFAHLLAIVIALLWTPKEMINYRLTVTNTTTWSLLIVVFYGFLLRPVPFFPLPIAKVTGILGLLGPYYGAQIQFIVLMVIITNFLTASIICFTIVCIFILDKVPKQIKMIRRSTGVCIAISLHLSNSSIVVLFMTKYYTIVNNLKQKVLIAYPFMKKIISDGTIIFGYFTAEPDNNPRNMSLIIFMMFINVTIIVLILYALLIRKLYSGTKASQKNNSSSKYRKTALAMLTSRICVPLIHGYIPIMAITGILSIDKTFNFTTTSLLLLAGISHGALNTLSTIAVFIPYRKGMFKSLNLILRKVFHKQVTEQKQTTSTCKTTRII